jgi:hypothetical protein
LKRLRFPAFPAARSDRVAVRPKAAASGGDPHRR